MAPNVAIEMLSNLKSLLDNATLQISSIQPIALDEENGLKFVSARVQAAGPYDKVIGFLQAVRAQSPRLLVGALDLTADPTQTSNSKANNYVIQVEIVHAVVAKRQ